MEASGWKKERRWLSPSFVLPWLPLCPSILTADPPVPLPCCFLAGFVHVELNMPLTLFPKLISRSSSRFSCQESWKTKCSRDLCRGSEGIVSRPFQLSVQRDLSMYYEVISFNELLFQMHARECWSSHDYRPGDSSFPLEEKPSSLCPVLTCVLPVCLAVVVLKSLAGHGLCTLHAFEVVSSLLGHSQHWVPPPHTHKHGGGHVLQPASDVPPGLSTWDDELPSLKNFITVGLWIAPGNLIHSLGQISQDKKTWLHPLQLWRTSAVPDPAVPRCAGG